VLAGGDPEFSLSPDRVARLEPSVVRGFDSALPAPKPLPGTRIDATEVAKIYGGEALLGASATEDAVRSRLPDADVVHLATHGYAHPYWAGASRIYLAGSLSGARDPDSMHDGLLEAWEISSQLKLRADLVVLAACETDRGHFVPGEGVDGLTRALLRAGARSVLASQWEVRDDSTRALSVELHRGIRAGLPKDEALRRARIAVARHPGWEHPYYWAPFTLTGDRENRLFEPVRRGAPNRTAPKKRRR
jgi:CHAT domain-containing protein